MVVSGRDSESFEVDSSKAEDDVCIHTKGDIFRDHTEARSVTGRPCLIIANDSLDWLATRGARGSFDLVILAAKLAGVAAEPVLAAADIERALRSLAEFIALPARVAFGLAVASAQASLSVGTYVSTYPKLRKIIVHHSPAIIRTITTETGTATASGLA